MHATDLPINRIIGMRLAPPETLHLIELNESSELLNHVGTIHASVQFALAEACSGEFLLQRLGNSQKETAAVLRTADVRFRKAAHGTLRASARFSDGLGEHLAEDLARKGRAFASIAVEVVDAHGVVTMKGHYEWFLQAMTQG